MQSNGLFKALVHFTALGALVLHSGKVRAAEGKAKTIGYYMDASDDYYKAGFQVFKALATKAGWQVQDVVGQGTAPEQIAAGKPVPYPGTLFKLRADFQRHTSGL